MSEYEGDGYDPHDDVPEWTDEDEERYQAGRHEELRRRRRRRRQGWSFFVLVLLVLGIGFGGAGIVQGWWEWPFGEETAAAECPDDPATIAAPGSVQVRVLNATETRGLASAIGTALTSRGYVVESVGNDEGDLEVLEGAQVRYGPGLEADARSVALNFSSAALVDDGRTGNVVDVAIGAQYRRMVPAEEVTAAIAAASPAPTEGCDAAAPAVDPAR